MKNLTLVALLLLSTAAFGQKKDKGNTALIDSLKTANVALTTLSDSLKTSLDRYTAMYAVIRDQVVKAEFKPENMAGIIDSLRTNRDSIINASGLFVLTTRDSLAMMKRMCDSLRVQNSGLMYTVNLLKGGTGNNPNSVAEFTSTWNLIMRKVQIVGDPSQKGIIDVSTNPVPKDASLLEANMISTIAFLDAEFAELTFSNGEKGKGYYVINNFSATEPYYVDFKGTKADIRMYFMHTPTGTRISFQIPGKENLYYFGQITR